MITNHLRVLMAERRINSIKELMEITGLSRNALNKLWHDEDIETIKLESLFKICDAFGIALSDLVEYRPEAAADDE